MENHGTGHRERLRARVREHGLESLRPHEVVELILFNAVPRVDVSEAARALLDRFGTTSAMLRAPEAELTSVPGVTRAMAQWIMMTGELVDAYAGVRRERLTGIARYRDVLDFLAPRWRDVPAPQSWVMYMDYDKRLITHTVACESLGWDAPPVVRDIVEEALALQASYVVLVMFTGPYPPRMDEDQKARLVAFSRTLRAIEIELMDCVLVGEDGFLSMNVEGGMDEVRREAGDKSLHEIYCESDDDIEIE